MSKSIVKVSDCRVITRPASDKYPASTSVSLSLLVVPNPNDPLSSYEDNIYVSNIGPNDPLRGVKQNQVWNVTIGRSMQQLGRGENKTMRSVNSYEFNGLYEPKPQAGK